MRWPAVAWSRPVDACPVGGPDLAVGKIQATGGGVITIADSNLESGTISASIAGTAGVNKNTSGNVTFSGANTYTGNTTVNMGTLNLTASSNTNPVKLVLNGVASTEDATLFAALDTVPKPASIGDPNPLSIRDVRREGKTVLVDVVASDADKVELFAEGPTPDWALPVPKLLAHGPPGAKRFAFDLDGLPPGASADGAALKLTLVGGERAYEFNVNLN